MQHDYGVKRNVFVACAGAAATNHKRRHVWLPWHERLEALVARLKQLAEQANMDFFYQTDYWMQSGPNCTSEALRRQAEARSALLEGLLHRHSQTWEEES